jgi:hypothetical protein
MTEISNSDLILQERADNQLRSVERQRIRETLFGRDRHLLEQTDPAQPDTVEDFLIMAASTSFDFYEHPDTEGVYQFQHPDGRTIQVRNTPNDDPITSVLEPDGSFAAVYNVTQKHVVTKPARMPFGSYIFRSHVFVDELHNKARIENSLESVRVLGRYATVSMVRNATESELRDAMQTYEIARAFTDQQS